MEYEAFYLYLFEVFISSVCIVIIHYATYSWSSKWWEEENIREVLVITKIPKTCKSVGRLLFELQPNKERKIESNFMQNEVTYF